MDATGITRALLPPCRSDLIGFVDLDGEYIARKGYEDVEPEPELLAKARWALT